MTENTSRVIIRTHFWPRFLRWAVVFQLAFGLLVGVTVVSRGLNGEPLVSLRDVLSWGVTAALLGGFCLVLTFRRRSFHAAEINHIGVWPFLRRWGRDPLYHWDEIDTVRVQVGLFGRRWLEVVPTNAPSFPLTARPAHPSAVLEALERYAGPDHPLTLAMAEVLEAGR